MIRPAPVCSLVCRPLPCGAQTPDAGYHDLPLVPMPVDWNAQMMRIFAVAPIDLNQGRKWLSG